MHLCMHFMHFMYISVSACQCFCLDFKNFRQRRSAKLTRVRVKFDHCTAKLVLPKPLAFCEVNLEQPQSC